MLHKTHIAFFLALFLISCGSPLNKMQSEKQRAEISNQDENAEENFIMIAGYNAKVGWLNGPYVDSSESSTLQIEFYNEDLQPVSLPNSYSLFITAEMGMGHGLADRGVFETDDQIIFINSQIKFYMNGAYNMTLYVYEDDLELGRSTWSFSF